MPAKKKKAPAKKKAPVRKKTDQVVKAEVELANVLKDTTKALEALEDGDLLQAKRRYFFFFMRGVMQGLGVVVAAIIVIPLIIWFLQQIQWVPILGDTVSEILDRVQTNEQIEEGVVRQ